MLTCKTENSVGQRMCSLILGPVVGLVYVICLPFMAITATVALLAGKVTGGIVALLRDLVFFGWRPSEAYLSGKKKRKKGIR